MNKVITISREYGAGGHTIGKRVAQELGIELYDKDIVRETVRASGYDTETVQQEEEEVSRPARSSRAFCPTVYIIPTCRMPFTTSKSGNSALCAHRPLCHFGPLRADEILPLQRIPCLNVFIHAGDIHRAERLRQMTGVADPTELQRMMAKKDSLRRNYYNHYTNRQWGDSHNYHLTLDSGVLGDELCAQMIISAARGMQ